MSRNALPPVPNSSGSVFRAFINNVLDGLLTSWSGAGRQSNPAIGQTNHNATTNEFEYFGIYGWNQLSMPPGVTVPFAGASIPTGWLECNGQAVSRTGYAALFAAIGTTFGVGDGTSTFNLPNLQNRVPVGSGGTYSRGTTGGEATHTLTTPEIPAHTHGLRAPAWADVGAGGYSIPAVGHMGGTYMGETDSIGGGGAHNNMQPFVAMPYIIKT